MKANNESYRELNIKFYDSLNQIFHINKYRTWSELAKEITLEKISETYKIFAALFPANLDRYSMLPKNDPKEKLTSIFHGTLDGKTIIGNIARYSLYCDEIIVFHPLQNPNITHLEYDPITKPNQWKYEFVNALYFYIVLQKWVLSGIVHLIENPFYFDKDGYEKLRKAAKIRVLQHNDLLKTPELLDEFDEIMREKFKTTLFGLSLNNIEIIIRKEFSNYTEGQIKNLALEFKEYSKTLPLYVDFGDTEQNHLIINRAGGSIEMIDAICYLTGAHSYTTQNFIKRQLEIRGTNPFWTKFGILYSGLKLTYLDKVDTSFVFKIRKEERIAGLRNSLREVYSFLEQTELDKIPDDKILDINDKINHEIKQSEAEWMKIIADAQKANLTAVTSASVIGAFIDPTKIIIPAIGLPSSIVIIELFKRKGLKSYRTKDPFSIFVDLKNRKPDFYSDLKNCIF